MHIFPARSSRTKERTANDADAEIVSGRSNSKPRFSRKTSSDHSVPSLQGSVKSDESKSLGSSIESIMNIFPTRVSRTKERTHHDGDGQERRGRSRSKTRTHAKGGRDQSACAAQCDKQDRRGRSRSKSRTSKKTARDHSVGSGHGYPLDFPNTEHTRRGRSSSRSKYGESSAMCCPNCSAKTDGIMMLFSDMDDDQNHRGRSRSSSIMSRTGVNSIALNMDQGSRGRAAVTYEEHGAGKGRRDRSSSIMSRASLSSLPMGMEQDPRMQTACREVESAARRVRKDRSTSKSSRSRSSSRDRSVDLAMAAAFGSSLQVEEGLTVRRPHIGWDGDVHHPESSGYAMPEKMMATYRALSSRGRSPSVEKAMRRVPVPPPPPRESSLPPQQCRSKSFEATRYESCLPLPPIKTNLSMQLPSASYSRESSLPPPPYRHESVLQPPLRSNNYVSSQMQRPAGNRMYPEVAVDSPTNGEFMNRSACSQTSLRSRQSSSSDPSSKKHSYCLTSDLEKQVATYKQDTCVTVPTFKSRPRNCDRSDSRSVDSSMSSRASEASLSSMEGSERSGTSSKKRVQFSPNTKPGSNHQPDDSSVNSLDSTESESSSMSFEELLFELFGSNTNPNDNNTARVPTGLASLNERHSRRSIKIRTEDEKPPPPVVPRMKGYGKMYSTSHMPREGLGDSESLPSMASSSISSDSRNSRSYVLDRQANSALLTTARDIINDATDYSKRRSGFILDED